MNHIGKNIRILRQRQSWSQGDVAKQLNISVPAYSKIETGLTHINLVRLEEIANIFKVSPFDIMTKDNEDIRAASLQIIEEFKLKVAEKDSKIMLLQEKIIELMIKHESYVNC